MPIDFAQPHWLWIGALACVALALLFVRAERKRRAGLVRFAAASPDTTVARRRRLARHGLALAGVALTFAALARPRAGFRMEPMPRRGVDLMFAVDTSKSMRASDLRPDRLTRAKLAVADLVRELDGDRVGLIAFAGAAFVQAPMTVDRTVFLESLDALDTDVIPVPGTDLASAIRAAEQAMGSEPEHAKVLVLLSDGEDLAGDVLASARDAASHGLVIYTVGVGSAAGSLIEITNAQGVRELVRDLAGQPVTSHLDEPTLRSIAQVTGGAYEPLGADGRGLDALYAIARAKLPVRSTAGSERKVYIERFQIPLALALACLFGELALGDRRRRRRGLVTAALGVALFVLPRAAAADPVSTYNDATATYRKGDFGGAQHGFEAALHTAEVGVQERAYYDLGNARYRVGQATLAKDRDATIAAWKSALEGYDAAIALTPGDGDAVFNRDYVAKKLAALEDQKKHDEQQKQQKQQQDQKQQKQDQKQQKQQKSGQQQQQQSGQQQQQKPGGQGQQPKDQPGQGQQPKDQQAQGQQPKDQQAQGQQPKDQQAQGQQPKDQQAQGQQPKDQQGQGQQPKDQQGQGQQPKPADAHDAAAAAEDAKRRAAGQLTRDEAVQLLDSVEHDLRPMAIHGRASQPTATTKTKDW